MKGLSPKQTGILNFIREFISEHDYPPSIRDIQIGCDISSTSVVDYNLKALERLGYIRRDREVSRAIELLERGARRTRRHTVPVIGQITAGRDNVFALRVKGTSMIDALVNDGDLVLMEQTSAADNGDMVAVWLKDR